MQPLNVLGPGRGQAELDPKWEFSRNPKHPKRPRADNPTTSQVPDIFVNAGRAEKLWTEELKVNNDTSPFLPFRSRSIERCDVPPNRPGSI